MVQTIIDLNEKEDRFLNIFKAQRGIKSKNEAFKTILKEYEQTLEKELEDKIFSKKVKEAYEEYEKNPNNKKFTKEEFLKEMDEW